MTPRRILFVDDEQAVLEGLRDALRPRRREWDMAFVGSGEAALASLAETACDIVVSDLRMPGMDGATLLAAVADEHPGTIRIVLSGHAELDTTVRAALVAHRLVSKPCDAQELARTLERACTLNGIADRVAMRRTANGAAGLPSAPLIYLELTRMLADPDADFGAVAEVVEQDVAMSAKLLQLANSAFFGRGHPTTSVRKAVSLVGLRTLHVLALSTHAGPSLGLTGDAPVPGFSVDALQQRATRVARLARMVRGRAADADDAFSAGLLLDVGLLVLAAQEPEQLRALMAAATAHGRTLAQTERDAGTVGHGEIGAHLLALWGLPLSIVEAVGLHTRPAALPCPTFDAAAATHIAAALLDTLDPHPLFGDDGIDGLDPAHLDLLGVTDRIPGWLLAGERLLTG